MTGLFKKMFELALTVITWALTVLAFIGFGISLGLVLLAFVVLIVLAVIRQTAIGILKATSYWLANKQKG